MSMTRKHFEGVAAAIKAARAGLGDPLSRAAVTLVASSIASYLATTNPAFDRDRFIAATKED